MSGTKAGGLKTAATIRKRYGKNFYKVIGREGGKISTTGGFASMRVGADGLTGRQRASVVGVKGGRISRRGRDKRPRRSVTEPVTA